MGVLYVRTGGQWVPLQVSGGGVQAVVAGTGITVNSTDPTKPVVASAATEAAWTPQPSTGALGTSPSTGWYRREGQWCTANAQIVFDSSFNGGANADVLWSIPFPPAFDQPLTCKLWNPATGTDWHGGGFYSAGQNKAVLVFPRSSSRADGANLRNADATGTPGSGVPAIPGAYPMGNGGNLIFGGRYMVAAGY